jgi:hypothetical protein
LLLLFVSPVLVRSQSPVLKLVSEKDHQKYLKLLPPGDDPILVGLRNNPRITFYTEKEMPKAYQHNDGVHDPYYNISATQPKEPFGNANREFPWKMTAGLDNASNAEVVNFVIFPFQGKIRWSYGVVSGEVGGGGGSYPSTYSWTYPTGTVFGEILLIREGKWITPFELRLRTKGKDGKWRPDVYRPFSHWTEFVEAVKEEDPSWKDNKEFVSYVNTKSVGETRFRDSHEFGVINRTALSDTLPRIPSKVVWKLLRRPFHSVAETSWIETNSRTGHAPTTQAPFHIVPRGYQAEALSVTRKDCMTCHSTVLQPTNNFDSLLRRDWYGTVRGSDGIFSFHIFDPGCISSNGFSQPVRFRKELLRVGLIEPR